MTLDQVTVTNFTIEFYNLTSLGSNFTNTNLTYDARADFYGLDTSLSVYHVNLSSYLFNSSSRNQNYNATFTPGQVLRTLENPNYVCSSAEQSILDTTIIFVALAIMLIPVLVLFMKGKLSLDTDFKVLIGVFIVVIFGVVFIQAIADSIVSFCG